VGLYLFAEVVYTLGHDLLHFGRVIRMVQAASIVLLSGTGCRSSIGGLYERDS